MYCITNTLRYVERMAKTKPFSFRVEPELKAEIDAAAKAENRSFTNMVETMLKEGVERRRNIAAGRCIGVMSNPRPKASREGKER